MGYLKGVLMGVSALVVSGMLFIAVFTIAIFVQSRGSGSGGIGVTFFSFGPADWIVAALIFVVGFLWELRRAAR